MNALKPIDAALDALDKGYVPIPCHESKKNAATKWKIWMNQTPTREFIQELFDGNNTNIAVLNKDHLTIDVDNADELDFVIDKAGSTPSIRQTPSGGFHLDYGIPTRARLPVGNRIKMHGRDIDLKAPGKGYVLIPPSTNQDGVPYLWIGDARGLVPVSDLPPPRIAWTRPRKRSVPKIAVPQPADDDYGTRIRRAESWLTCVEGAISGYSGHNKTMRVAGKLIQYFRLNYEDAFRLMSWWNEVCEPPWSDTEIRHKLDSAVANKDKYT